MFGIKSTKSGCQGQVGRAEASLEAARVAQAKGEFDKALTLTLIAVDHADTARARGLARRGLVAAGDLLVVMGETDQALQMYQKALLVAPEAADDLQVLLKLTSLLHQQGRPTDAHAAAERASRLAERLHAPALFSRAAHWLGWLDYDEARWSDAEAHFHAALTSCYLAGEPSPATRAGLLLYLGNAVAQQGRLAEAQGWLEQSLACAERAADHALGVHARHSLAVVYALGGDLDRASRLLRECLALLQATGDSAGCAETLSELARVASRKALPVRAAEPPTPAPARVAPALPA